MGDTGLDTSFWLMVMLQTIGSVDTPGKGDRKMPAPRAYVAILITWSVLQMFADNGEGAARAAKTASWVMVLAGLVVGPMGKKLSDFINDVADIYGRNNP